MDYLYGTLLFRYLFGKKETIIKVMTKESDRIRGFVEEVADLSSFLKFSLTIFICKPFILKEKRNQKAFKKNCLAVTFFRFP